MEFDFTEGAILPVNKPKFWTSFDVVNKIRHLIKNKTGVKKIKVGHAGTLDPLATGLLLVFTGKATKKISAYIGLRKTYEGIIQLGATTPSYDLETDIDQTFPTAHITEEMILGTAGRFMGWSEQVPPVFSAKKVKGKKSYELARRGIMPDIKAQRVELVQFDILQINMPQIAFRITCSSGTYIRSIAHDFGKELGSGAHLVQLERTAIGAYMLADAYSMDYLKIKIA